MPQLNPAPWFFILLMSWLVYLMMAPKTSNLKTLNELTIKNDKNTASSWNWPWT
uniref:ATP synthase complex subunit 8 n=1 Tax=Thorius n. sp. RLM-2004 TaxID=291261 RepID=Q644Q2_9SALA|nr:ATP synthase F0 subunit 8 [Thorius n. sp. RLM-2004]AAU20582.1 ATP synthase F0 subunit 8 [Thorius n. sp. RLM-2004]